ncbi:T-cell surface glycoprotein CD3 epsilon chain [Arapaima gigas]
MKKVLLFFSLSLIVMAEEGNVKFTFQNVEVTCPEEPKSWHGDKIQQSTEKIIKLTGNEGLFYCTYATGDKTKKYFYYIKGVVCDNCFEFSGTWVSAIITGDLLVTVGVMVAVYHCTQRKPRAPAAASVQATTQQTSSNNRVYETLDPQTRDNDVYSFSGMPRTG